MHTRDQKTKERKQINKMAPTVIMWKREMRVRKEIETFFRYYFLYIYRLVFVLSLWIITNYNYWAKKENNKNTHIEAEVRRKWMRVGEKERERTFLQIGFHRLGMEPVELKIIMEVTFLSLEIREGEEMQTCWTSITKHSQTHSACEAPKMNSLLFLGEKERGWKRNRRENAKRL